MRPTQFVLTSLIKAGDPGRRDGLLALSALFLLAGACDAQVDRSGLSGTITDSAGRMLPQSRITVVESATGLHRETSSDAHGSYSIPDLPIGSYVVTIKHKDFRQIDFVGVKQVIGRTRTLDATLEVAGGEERVEVAAGSELLDRNTATITGLIEKTQADELPLNGRNWSELTAYIPGAIDTGGSNQRSIRFAGRGLDDSNFTYDGIDSTSIINQTQRPWVRLAIPLDAIAQFRVDSLGATAEEGGSGGAQLDVSSPSGTNRFHGRLFEYLRNNIFDAPEPQWASNGEAQQRLRLNQFGASLGGPVVRDKTFFFSAFEAYRQVWGYPVSGDVPSAALIRSVPASSPVYAVLKSYPGVGPQTILAPTSDPNIDLLTCSCTQVVNENSILLRLDHRFSDRTSGFMRFNYDRSVNTQPVSAAATDLQQKVATPVNGAIEMLHLFSPTLVNEAKFGFNRSTNNAYNSSGTGSIYQIAVSSITDGFPFVGQNYSYNTIYVGNTFSGIDDLTLTRGRHTLKAGGEFRRIQLNQSYGEHGTVTFRSVEDLAVNAVKSAKLTGALPINHLRKNDVAGYFQDEYKATHGFTLNLGARYTFFQLFSEVNGQANPFDFETCGPQGFCGSGAAFGSQNYGDFDPRVGLSWSPYKDGKTVIRAGFGTYHEDGQLDDQNLPSKNTVASYSVKSSKSLQVTYPVTGFLSGPGTLSPNAEQRNRKDSYVEQWDLSMQQQFGSGFVGTLSYLGSHGVHLLETNVVNLYTDLNANPLAVQYPAFASGIGWRGSVGMSGYNGLSASLRRSFTKGLLVAVNYTYSHGIDNGSNGSGDGDELSPQNPLCLACEIGSSTWDARHVINGNAVYQLPFGIGKPMLNGRGLGSAIGGNWELTTMALARTGFPVNVVLPANYSLTDYAGQQRPDLVPGVSLTPAGGRHIGQWINPAAFTAPAGQYGDAPRNVARGPGTWQMDFSADKKILLNERAQLELRSEFFNIFNHPQLGQPGSIFTPGNPTGFGSITSTVNLNTAIVNPITPVGSGTPREIQFAIRFDF